MAKTRKFQHYLAKSKSGKAVGVKVRKPLKKRLTPKRHTRRIVKIAIRRLRVEERKVALRLKKIQTRG